METEPHVIPTSLIGPTEGVSHTVVRRVVKELRDEGALALELSPTGRARLTVDGYQKVRARIRAAR